MAIFKGAGVAIVTPMKENLEVNYEKLEELVDSQIKGGTDAIIITGTTGESSTMTEEEHLDVIRACVQYTNHRIPVIAGTGSNCTKTAVYLSQEAEKAGADGLLVVTPYYNKATQPGLIAHYTQIADAVKLPVIMYNVPARTGCNLLPCGKYYRLKRSDGQYYTGVKDDGSDRRKDRYVFRRRCGDPSAIGNRCGRRNFCMVKRCASRCA